MTFCKLFETPEHGQILVKLDTNDDNHPEVRFFASPEDLGVCTVAPAWPDTEEGWAQALAYFEAMDEAQARKTADYIFAFVAGDEP